MPRVTARKHAATAVELAPVPVTPNGPSLDPHLHMDRVAAALAQVGILVSTPTHSRPARTTHRRYDSP